MLNYTAGTSKLLWHQCNVNDALEEMGSLSNYAADMSKSLSISATAMQPKK